MNAGKGMPCSVTRHRKVVKSGFPSCFLITCWNVQTSCRKMVVARSLNTVALVVASSDGLSLSSGGHVTPCSKSSKTVSHGSWAAAAWTMVKASFRAACACHCSVHLCRWPIGTVSQGLAKACKSSRTLVSCLWNAASSSGGNAPSIGATEGHVLQAGTLQCASCLLNC